ncbi:hypothetical protein F341_015 [Campylobacter phage F341]|nr:hypothetical protein F341_015 [Campylobacter phage F341]
MLKKLCFIVTLASSLFAYNYMDSTVIEDKGNIVIELSFCTKDLDSEKKYIIDHFNNQIDGLEQQQVKSEVYQYRGKQYVFNKGKNVKYNKPIVTFVPTSINGCYIATALYKIKHDDIKTSVNNKYESYFNGFITKNTSTKNEVENEIKQNLENEIKENIIIKPAQIKNSHETFVEVPEYLYTQTKENYYINIVCEVTNSDNEFVYNFEIKDYKRPLIVKGKIWGDLTPYFNTNCKVELVGK